MIRKVVVRVEKVKRKDRLTEFPGSPVIREVQDDPDYAEGIPAKKLIAQDYQVSLPSSSTIQVERDEPLSKAEKVQYAIEELEAMLLWTDDVSGVEAAAHVAEILAVLREGDA